MTVVANRPCTVSDCSKRVLARNLCSAHYNRLIRHGQLELQTTPTRLVLEELVLLQTDECVVWPRGKVGDGYGQVSIDGKELRAHVVACERWHGPPPTPKHHAAHSCGNPPCINGRHLRWATASENAADKVAHGTHQRGERSPRARLTTPQVIEILERLKSTSPTPLARELGIPLSTISSIARRRSWAWLDPDAYLSPPPAA